MTEQKRTVETQPLRALDQGAMDRLFEATDALGLSLDDFQRLHVGPAGVSVIDYSGPRPMVLCVNSGSGVAGLVNASHGAPTVGGGDIPK